MFKNRLLQLVAVVVLLVAVAASGVAVRTASAADHGVPFKASVAGTASFIDATHFELVGEGQASHLGKVKSYEAEGTLTEFDANVPTADILIETLTAANGDTLTIRCDQVLEEISPGVFHGTDTWTVIGGTGRFSNASGSGAGETIANLNVGTFTKEMTGVITY